MVFTRRIGSRAKIAGRIAGAIFLASVTACAMAPVQIDYKTAVPAHIVRKICDDAGEVLHKQAHWDGEVRWLRDPDGALYGMQCELMTIEDLMESPTVIVELGTKPARPLTLYLKSQGWTIDGDLDAP